MWSIETHFDGIQIKTLVYLFGELHFWNGFFVISAISFRL